IFQNLRTSPSEEAKRQRIRKGKPGTACPKGYLSFNTEFTERAICTASRQYQKKKIAELESAVIDPQKRQQEIEAIMEKSCICHELGGGALIKHKIETPEEIQAAICPGPNIAYFKKTYSLADMIGHIYGKINLLHTVEHPNMFITELRLYIEALKRISTECMHSVTEKEKQYIRTFYENIHKGIEYYKGILGSFRHVNEQYRERMADDLTHLKNRLEKIIIDYKSSFRPQEQAAVPVTASL
ncbi:hypothetical protein DRN98_10035, partial [Methanosarcinales archaeon]